MTTARITPARLLPVPILSALAALATGAAVPRLGVALSCALLLLWSFLRGAGERGRDVFWVIAALALSMGGDSFLSHRGGREWFFIAGIALFFGAHVGYLNYALRRGRMNWAVLGALGLIYLPYYGFCLWPGIRSPVLALAVLAYLLISCLVFSAACGLRPPAGAKWLFISGIGFLVFSDTVISLSEFMRWREWNRLIMPTYYLSHILITWGVLAGCQSSDTGGITSDPNSGNCRRLS